MELPHRDRRSDRGLGQHIATSAGTASTHGRAHVRRAVERVRRGGHGARMGPDPSSVRVQRDDLGIDIGDVRARVDRDRERDDLRIR